MDEWAVDQLLKGFDLEPTKNSKRDYGIALAVTVCLPYRKAKEKLKELKYGKERRKN